MMYNILAPLFLSIIISVLTGYILIPFLKSKKLGQKILDIGPRWHKSKEGTPIMGGFLFILAVLLSLLIFGIAEMRRGENPVLLITFLMALCFGIIGFADDYMKLFKKQNQGLTAPQKLLFQFFIAIIYTFVMAGLNLINTELFIPFVKISVDLGIFYYVFIVLGMVYLTNAVNLTDGVDGLCGSVTAVIMVMFVVFSASKGDVSGAILSSAVFGGLLGFLFFNFYPAKVFMGDTGSLFLGGIVSGLAVWFGIPLLLLVFGAVYIAEALSVMIQVTGFKLTGKRVFKMSPLHHHFEMCGWSEVKIVSLFVLITAAGSVLSYLGAF